MLATLYHCCNVVVAVMDLTLSQCRMETFYAQNCYFQEMGEKVTSYLLVTKSCKYLSLVQYLWNPQTHWLSISSFKNIKNSQSTSLHGNMMWACRSILCDTVTQWDIKEIQVFVRQQQGSHWGCFNNLNLFFPLLLIKLAVLRDCSCAAHLPCAQ
jgi:hypothetical protein